ncbi:MAG: fibronectin type III domain-containing protein [Thermoanaerobaculaceae bacterium]|jgi:Leucine-rich repeat (LRR) protein|nr:fibronectin type III domain-containing protein [Thermoanaerobaculaceae bacterium]
MARTGRLVCWVLGVSLLGAGVVEAAIPSTERDALVALYGATGGASWTERQGWLGAAGTECTWRGVVCDQAGEHVVELGLWSNNLSGPLPAAISGLTRLQNAYLCCNHISGAIPESIGSLSQLVRLYLYSNELTGALPEALGQLASLEELRLAYNQISGTLPAALGNLGKLRQLDLSENKLTGEIPAAFASLDALQELDLPGNDLSGAIPPELAGMASLQRLNLAGNALTASIPPELGSATTLRRLDVSGNQLSGAIPSTLGNLPNLEVLALGYNRLSGGIPTQLGSLAALVRLYLGSNQLTGSIPPEFGALAKLEELSLESNQLTGTVPSQLGNLASLRGLGLQNNQLTGPLPAELGNLANLESLSLWSNLIDGPLPASLGTLSKLTWLAACCNRFSGPIPPALGQLTHLRQLYLYSNQLAGPIPSELGNLVELRLLALDGNGLTGTIPASLANLTLIEDFAVSGNQLTGAVPAWLAGLSHLRRLDLSGNQLTGTIPAGLGQLGALTALSLANNRLTGGVPPELGSLAELQYLLLDQNQLTGTVPASLGSLGKLIRLLLSHNQLTGPIPAELGGMSSLVHLHLWDNHLSGPIPPALGGLSNLEELYLSRNLLTGGMPAELGGLAKVRQLHVAGNQLVGAVPAALQSLTSLQDGWGVDLRWNGLYTTSSGLKSFLDQKQGGDWSASQTVAPTGVKASDATASSVKVSWTPIAYTANGGGYRVLYSLVSGGPFTLAGTTQGKLATELSVTGLAPGATYHFAVQTQTDPHADNQGTVVSTRSTVASLATTGQPERAILPGIARQNGQNNTTWRSEGVMTNPLAVATNVLLEIIPRDGSAAAARKAYDLAPGQVVQVADLYTEIGLGGGAGALRVTGPVAGWVRTYNQGTQGTFGQDVVPAAAAAFDAGEAVVFPVYTPADVLTDFRSNFLASNLESTPITLTLRIGTRSLDVPVPAATYVQRNLVGQLVGAPAGLGILEVTGTGRWSGTVSSVDPITGDPATVRALRPAEAGGTAVFAGVASQAGQNDTQWRSQAVLYNPSAASQSVTLEIVPRGASAPAASLGVTLQPGEVRQIGDLFAELGAGTGAGALRVTGAVLAWVRTFNQGVSGTFGQDVPPVRAAEWSAAETVLFPFERPAILADNFRSNLLLLNQGVGVLHVTLSGGGKTKTTTVDPGTYAQINNVGQYLGAPAGVAILSVTADGPWSGYVSTIDPSTGDPTTVRGLPKP